MKFLICLLSLAPLLLDAQTNMRFTNPQIAEIVHGNFTPGDYADGAFYASPEDLAASIHSEVSQDSLKAYLLALRQFETRNTGSDTLSPTRGIGAARTWIHDRLMIMDTRLADRLEVGYFQFDQAVCGMGRHKNVVAALPGTDPAAPLIIIQAHMDSRCATVCDTDCLAQGMEDNGSGTALVIELARVLGRYRFPNTILFVATTGEEQGLIGANAMAQYFANEDVEIKLVQNNDIVGGIICGETSSPPSCPGLNHVDSTQVRLFSHGSFNSRHKALCRYIKLQYEEMLEPIVPVPMRLTVMSAEDRTGRGGDHIPYRQRGYPAMRFTSANEHGNANTNDPDYHDRQHTSQDLLGVDTDSDGELDSFFVNFNYLARNAVINGNATAMAAIGPQPPEIVSAFFDGDTIYIELASEIDYPQYVLGVRTDSHDFDSLYYMDSKFGVFVTAEREFSVFLSAASIDSNGVESLFSEEVLNLISATDDPAASTSTEPAIRLMGNRPNPFDEATTLSFWVEKPVAYRSAYILITDLQGRKVAQLETEVRPGLNELIYHHGYNVTGILVQTLVIDGVAVDSKQMIYAN